MCWRKRSATCRTSRTACGGDQLKLAAGEILHTDTETIFLPPLLARLPTPQLNFLLYKAMVAMHWDRIRFGPFRLDLQAPLEGFAEPAQALALLEARRDGIHPYCITIDREARDYLPHLQGLTAYTIIIDEVRQLPLKVSDIYRRLTT